MKAIFKPNCDCEKLPRPQITQHSKDGWPLDVEFIVVCGRCGKYYKEEEVKNMDRWNLYFYKMAQVVASQSRCASRQIGAIIVKDKSVVSTGYNGPPKGMSHCGEKCPRRQAGYPSGEGLWLCPAAHAEANAIANAAKLGVSVAEGQMFMTCEVPCKSCLGLIINAGITDVIVAKKVFYDHISEKMVKEGLINVRTFERME